MSITVDLVDTQLQVIESSVVLPSTIQKSDVIDTGSAMYLVEGMLYQKVLGLYNLTAIVVSTFPMV